MSTKRRLTEAEALEFYRVALTNAESYPEISQIMSSQGYNSEILSIGKQLLKEAREVYDECISEKEKMATTHNVFSTKREALNLTFDIHRKKAKIIFKRDKLASDKLSIDGRFPKTYIKWIEAVKKFYKVADSDQNLQKELARLNLTTEEITHGLDWIEDLEAVRAKYMKEKGDSQKATKRKNATFVKIDDWMDDFYKVAKIAFKDEPQQLESLGIIVKS